MLRRSRVDKHCLGNAARIVVKKNCASMSEDCGLVTFGPLGGSISDGAVVVVAFVIAFELEQAPPTRLEHASTITTKSDRRDTVFLCS